MGRFQRLPKEVVLQQIIGSGGIVRVVAKRLGISDWYTAQRLINKWAETKEAFKAEAEGVLDLAESVVVKRIGDGDIATAKWYLTKKGKERGYADDLAALLDDEPLKIEFTGGGVTRESMEADPNVEIFDGGKEEEGRKRSGKQTRPYSFAGAENPENRCGCTADG